MNSVRQLVSQEDVFFKIRSWASPELLTFLDQMLILLPEELKFRLKKVIDTIPPDTDNVYQVLELVRAQWKGLQSYTPARIVLVGPAQTGKKSLVKAILRKQEPRQSDTDQSIFNIVDHQMLEKYLGRAPEESQTVKFRRANVVLFVLDARYGLSDATVEFYEQLTNAKKPVLVVLNKIDLLEHPGSALKEAKRHLDTAVLGVSCFKRETLDKLLKTIVSVNPRILYSLTRNFPELRQAMCDGIVTQTAFAAGIIGAIPIPISNLLPLAVVQSAMILKIARAFGYKLSRQRARELLPVLAGGALVCKGAQRLRNRFPQYREFISVSVGGAWTFILGWTAIRYFEKLSNIPNKDRAEHLLQKT